MSMDHKIERRCTHWDPLAPPVIPSEEVYSDPVFGRGLPTREVRAIAKRTANRNPYLP